MVHITPFYWKWELEHIAVFHIFSHGFIREQTICIYRPRPRNCICCSCWSLNTSYSRQAFRGITTAAIITVLCDMLTLKSWISFRLWSNSRDDSVPVAAVMDRSFTHIKLSYCAKTAPICVRPAVLLRAERIDVWSRTENYSPLDLMKDMQGNVVISIIHRQPCIKSTERY